MFLWFLAFWMLGYCAVPNSLDLLGLDGADLSARGQALLHLLLECGELGATVGILWHSLRAYRPLNLGWFRARARPLRAWLCPALLACAFFPLVDLAAARSQGWFPIDKDLWGPNMMEQNLAAGDVVSKAVYFVVVTVCAPVWEEAIFRGFLLPSLTKYMPAMAAVAVSALGFAGAHFSMQRFLPIMLLGMILGTLYVRTRNLLPCVLLHSLWNAYIFWQLTCRGTVVM
ncbi:hypothetical protein CVIRNUC_005059 [Coccomyxa viridis]|uniref:CAAX prenyl protease 2/Lysostaphin resistance protein A-like domain-containing protein n=1 Tax=Coccomyxa viridis TaxID=1274662 RepID=A0AAV1I4Z8_9CHLO|nr:hypothetical protein CVIRNUC_005059 [Coccomyxa viridis]